MGSSGKNMVSKNRAPTWVGILYATPTSTMHSRCSGLKDCLWFSQQTIIALSAQISHFTRQEKYLNHVAWQCAHQTAYENPIGICNF